MNDVLKAREILGNEANRMTDEQVKSLLAFVDYICEGWLDKFEISTFGRVINDLTIPKE